REPGEFAQPAADDVTEVLRNKSDDVEAAICCPHAVTSLPQNGNEAMQRLCRSCFVLNHGNPDIAFTGIAAVVLLACEVASRDDSHASLRPQVLGHHLASAVLRNLQPEKKSAGWPHVSVATADDLIGEIEFCGIELTVFLHMRFVAIGGDRHVLGRCRHLRRCDVAQFEIWREKSPIAGSEADTQAR